MTLVRQWSLAGLAAVVMCAMVAAGCGTGSSPKSTTTPTGSTGTTAAPGSASVKIGKAVDTIGFTTVDVALDKGYFSQAGIHATSELLNGSSTAFAALVAGSVQFVTASSTALMLARGKGLPLESIASLDDGVPLELLVANRWIAKKHLSLSQPLDQRIRGLAGAKIAEVSQTDEAFFGLLFKDAGLSPSSVSAIHVGGAAAELAALKHGEIDAFLISPPAANFAQAQGGGTILATLKDLPVTRNMAYDIVVADTNYAKADNLIQNHPREVLPLEEKHFPKYSASVLSASLTFVHFARDGLQTQTMWNDAETVNRETGELKTAVPVTEGTAWTNQYIDTSALAS